MLPQDLTPGFGSPQMDRPEIGPVGVGRPAAHPCVALEVISDAVCVADHPALRGLVHTLNAGPGLVVRAAAAGPRRPQPVPVAGGAGPLRLLVLVDTPMSMHGKSLLLREIHDLLGPQGVMAYLPDRDDGLIGRWQVAAAKAGFAFAQTLRIPGAPSGSSALVASRTVPACSAGAILKFG